MVGLKPASINHYQAAALALTTLTAMIALEDTAQLVKGQKLLVQGGAGGVGSVGIQIGHFLGAHVITTASPGNHDYVSGLGADEVIKLPGWLDDQTAAAAFSKGCTVQYLLRRIYPVKPGDTILLHAAAGGVGLIACQWAKHLGATVIGTVGSDEKAELARAHGCDHTIVYSRENIVERVKALTDGAGVPVVYDSVGKDTFIASLDCLQPRGLMVSYGNASGPVDPFSPSALATRGSLFLTRPTLASYISTREELDVTAADLFGVVESGAVKIGYYY